jgi:hypothetical protein
VISNTGDNKEIRDEEYSIFFAKSRIETVGNVETKVDRKAITTTNKMKDRNLSMERRRTMRAKANTSSLDSFRMDGESKAIASSQSLKYGTQDFRIWFSGAQIFSVPRIIRYQQQNFKHRSNQFLIPKNYVFIHASE